MTDDPKREQVIREITESWALAQEQFKALREAVDHAAKLAQLQEHAAFLGRERERALLGLGEMVWQEVKRGTFAPPPPLGAALRSVEAVERQRVAHAAEISALLAEGADAAARMAKKKAAPPPTPSKARPPPTKLPPRTPLARDLKKR